MRGGKTGFVQCGIHIVTMFRSTELASVLSFLPWTSWSFTVPIKIQETWEKEANSGCLRHHNVRLDTISLLLKVTSRRFPLSLLENHFQGEKTNKQTKFMFIDWGTIYREWESRWVSKINYWEEQKGKCNYLQRVTSEKEFNSTTQPQKDSVKQHVLQKTGWKGTENRGIV